MAALPVFLNQVLRPPWVSPTPAHHTQKKMLQPTVNREHREPLFLVSRRSCVQGREGFHVPLRNMSFKGNELSAVVHTCVPVLRRQRQESHKLGPAWATRHVYAGICQILLLMCKLSAAFKLPSLRNQASVFPSTFCLSNSILKVKCLA